MKYWINTCTAPCSKLLFSLFWLTSLDSLVINVQSMQRVLDESLFPYIVQSWRICITKYFLKGSELVLSVNIFAGLEVNIWSLLFVLVVVSVSTGWDSMAVQDHHDGVGSVLCCACLLCGGMTCTCMFFKLYHVHCAIQWVALARFLIW